MFEVYLNGGWKFFKRHGAYCLGTRRSGIRNLNSKTQIVSRFRMLAILNNLGDLSFRSVMGIDNNVGANQKSFPVGPDGKKLKPCCACPETKRVRDACIVEKGEENCMDLIEAHKACMRSLGFNI